MPWWFVRELLAYWRDDPPIVDYLAIFDRAYIKRNRGPDRQQTQASAPWMQQGLAPEERERLAREAIRGIKASVGETGLLRVG